MNANKVLYRNDNRQFNAIMKWMLELREFNKTQEEMEDEEAITDILSEKLWDLSEKIMNCGTKEQKDFMEEWAEERGNKWNGNRWEENEN